LPVIQKNKSPKSSPRELKIDKFQDAFTLFTKVQTGRFMNRRNFISYGLLVLTGMGLASKNVFAAIVWVSEGTAGYKNKAPIGREKKNQKCMTCKWFSDDGVEKEGGLCTLAAINKGKKVYVKKDGVCNLWQIKKV
jgi:hypothetical protein